MIYNEGMFQSGFLPILLHRLSALGYTPGDELHWKYIGIQATSRNEWWILALLYFNPVLAKQPDRPEYSAYVLTLLDSQLQLKEQIWLDDVKARLHAPFGSEPSQVFDTQFSFGLTLTDQPLITTGFNRAFILDATGRHLVKSYDVLLNQRGSDDFQRIYSHNFAWRIQRTPDNRLLCILGEQNKNTRFFEGNMIALSDTHADLCLNQPSLCYIARLHDWRHSQDYGFPYVHMPNGLSWHESVSPEPLLWRQLHEQGYRFYNEWLHQIIPLKDERFLLSIFNQRLRGGTKGCPFVFGLFDYEGQMLGTLQLDRHKDSPYPGYFYDVLTDWQTGYIFYRNKENIYLFDLNGFGLHKIALSQPELKGLSAFVLAASSSDGHILWLNPKEHTLMCLPPLQNQAGFETWLVRGIKAFQLQRKQFRKTAQYAKYLWWV